MNKYFLYFLNVVLIALPLALFEIAIEKDAGWGSGWRKDRWYAKPFAPRSRVVAWVSRALNIEPPLNYHAAVFGAALPIIFIAEYFLLSKNVAVLSASMIGVPVFEDFFWFLFNWYFKSLRELLKGPAGSVWWHKWWMKISRTHYLPASYPAALLVSAALLLLA